MTKVKKYRKIIFEACIKAMSVCTSLQAVFENLFQNGIVSQCTSETLITIAKVNLTPQQIATLTLPAGFSSLVSFLLIQTDTLASGSVISTDLQLVSFIHLANSDNSCSLGHIYGYYYFVTNQSRLDPNIMRCNSHGITLDAVAVFTPEDYMEVYIKVGCIIVALGLQSPTGAVGLASELFFSQGCKFYSESLSPTGVTSLPVAKNTGLSKSLQASTCQYSS